MANRTDPGEIGAAGQVVDVEIARRPMSRAKRTPCRPAARGPAGSRRADRRSWPSPRARRGERPRSTCPRPRRHPTGGGTRAGQVGPPGHRPWPGNRVHGGDETRPIGLGAADARRPRRRGAAWAVAANCDQPRRMLEACCSMGRTVPSPPSVSQLRSSGGTRYCPSRFSNNSSAATASNSIVIARRSQFNFLANCSAVSD